MPSNWSPRLTCLVLFIAGLAARNPAGAGQPPNDVLEEPLVPKLAQEFFEEAKAISEKDGGRLWGLPLYGAMFFADARTRAIVANQADREGRLTKEGEVFVGTLPEQVIIANTATHWAGVHWTMLVWPMPKDRHERARLMAHEMWHRIQHKLDLPMSDPANSHLDTREGRIWLQLECRALTAALRQSGLERRRAIEDALTFRAYRRALFPEGAAKERALEMNEGLAEYTGVRLSDDSEAGVVARALKNLQDTEKWDTFVRSFAYATGPAYGLLLDEAGPGWRKGLSVNDDLGQRLREATSISLSDTLKIEALKRGAAYDADSLAAAETERDAARLSRVARYRQRLVTGPVLSVPMRDASFGFNPLGLQPLDDLGTVYPTLKLMDVWGVLNVTGGALIYADRSRVSVPAPNAPATRPLQGDGWTLELKDGWELRPGERKGDYTVEKVN